MFYKNTEALYKNPDDYDKELVGSDTNEISFYQKYIKNGSILYLGSGSGRLLKHFLPLNSDITGIEISEQMIKKCKETSPKVNILNQDVLKLQLPRKFDVIIAPYRFICHFDKNSVEKLFKAVATHLNPNGVFIGDLFTPYLPKDRSIKVEFDDLMFTDMYAEKTYNVYSHDKQLCVEVLERNWYEGGRTDFIKLDWYYYYPKQLQEFGEKNNLQALDFYGSFKNDPFTENTNQLIFQFKKI